MKMFLYSGEKPKALKLKKYLDEKVRANVTVRRDFIDYHGAGCVDEIAQKLAGIRVADLASPFTPNEPLYGEIEYEKRVISGGAKPFGVMYDGVEFHEILGDLVPERERNLDCVHIAITDRLLGTFDEEDLRYHARVIVCGFPSVISTTGVIEAPAKPREFYIEKGLIGRDDIALEKLKDRFRARFIDYGDSRMPEILKGYVMQALFYQAFGEVFCEDKGCRLYNAHWQEEMIGAQMSEEEFCERHRGMLEGV